MIIEAYKTDNWKYPGKPICFVDIIFTIHRKYFLWQVASYKWPITGLCPVHPVWILSNLFWILINRFLAYMRQIWHKLCQYWWSINTLSIKNDTCMMIYLYNTQYICMDQPINVCLDNSAISDVLWNVLFDRKWMIKIQINFSSVKVKLFSMRQLWEMTGY